MNTALGKHVACDADASFAVRKLHYQQQRSAILVASLPAGPRLPESRQDPPGPDLTRSVPALSPWDVKAPELLIYLPGDKHGSVFQALCFQLLILFCVVDTDSGSVLVKPGNVKGCKPTSFLEWFSGIITNEMHPLNDKKNIISGASSET